MKNKSIKIKTLVTLAIAVSFLPPLEAQEIQKQHPTTPLLPRAVTPAPVAPRPAGTPAPPLPVVVELFVTGDDAANQAALTLLKSLPAKMPQENILTMSEHVSTDKAARNAALDTGLIQRHYVMHHKFKMNDLKAPLMMVDGAVQVTPINLDGVRQAIATMRKQNRQLVTVDAYISGKKLKLNVFADYKRKLTEDCRIGAFIWSSPVGDQEPVIRQVVDFGYLNSGHVGVNTIVVPLDANWYKPELYKQLNVVAVVHNCATGKIIGASSCAVQKSKDGWF